ncbi:hypothetical protein [Agrococcus beijingensis]|uniref:hypothetical protein n=1 Tax=Agrococcus beijingensis TaxID=3068634 RepID=UPI002740C33F|nr:hypothetical protein [Agrococcus sp. REN33]
MTNAAVVDLHALPQQHPAPSPAPERERHLRALPVVVPRRSPRLVHGIVAMVGLGAVVCAQLGLSVVISEGAYRMSALQGESTVLARAEQSIAEEIAVLASPQHVAVAAGELGMLGGQPSQFLTLAGTATAGGPDAMHMQVPAVDQFGMYVPNALLAAEPQAAAVVAEVQAEATLPYPGMLLPPGESVPAPAAAPVAPAAPAAPPAPAPGTLLPATPTQ